MIVSGGGSFQDLFSAGLRQMRGRSGPSAHTSTDGLACGSHTCPARSASGPAIAGRVGFARFPASMLCTLGQSRLACAFLAGTQRIMPAGMVFIPPGVPADFANRASATRWPTGATMRAFLPAARTRQVACQREEGNVAALTDHAALCRSLTECRARHRPRRFLPRG